MFEINGKINKAICYTNIIENEAIEQIRRMCDNELTKDSKIRIMPDVHSGKGCTVGTTMTIFDKAVPNIVGVDIGCGMYVVKLKEKEIDFKKFDEVAHYIPSGMYVWEKAVEQFDLTKLRCFKMLKGLKRLESSLGTLGGGNHFIEIEKSIDGTLYLIIHSGSRNLGKQVAAIYQQMAFDLHKGKEEYLKTRLEIISTYKEQGKQAEIQKTLKKLEKDYEKKELPMPEELCYLYGKELDDYLHDVKICQQFATRNREIISEILLNKSSLTVESSFHTIHNYIDTEEMILRKGAIAAHKNEKVLIPINMKDGSILAIGKGNPEWNYSAPHGAGRLMSRTKAKETLDLTEYKEVMKGIYTTSVNELTIDEAPMAYKSLNDIVDVIKETVDIVEVMKPIYNFKAADDDLPWLKNKN